MWSVFRALDLALSRVVFRKCVSALCLRSSRSLHGLVRGLSFGSHLLAFVAFRVSPVVFRVSCALGRISCLASRVVFHDMSCVVFCVMCLGSRFLCHIPCPFSPFFFLFSFLTNIPILLHGHLHCRLFFFLSFSFTRRECRAFVAVVFFFCSCPFF